jgi:hypothetical protein
MTDKVEIGKPITAMVCSRRVRRGIRKQCGGLSMEARA